MFVRAIQLCIDSDGGFVWCQQQLRQNYIFHNNLPSMLLNQNCHKRDLHEIVKVEVKLQPIVCSEGQCGAGAVTQLTCHQLSIGTFCWFGAGAISHWISSFIFSKFWAVFMSSMLKNTNLSYRSPIGLRVEEVKKRHTQLQFVLMGSTLSSVSPTLCLSSLSSCWPC